MSEIKSLPINDFQKKIDAVDMSSERMQKALKENALLQDMAKGFDTSCPTCGAEDFEDFVPSEQQEKQLTTLRSLTKHEKWAMIQYYQIKQIKKISGVQPELLGSMEDKDGR